MRLGSLHSTTRGTLPPLTLETSNEKSLNRSFWCLMVILMSVISALRLLINRSLSATWARQVVGRTAVLRAEKPLKPTPIPSAARVASCSERHHRKNRREPHLAPQFFDVGQLRGQLLVVGLEFRRELCRLLGLRQQLGLQKARSIEKTEPPRGYLWQLSPFPALTW